MFKFKLRLTAIVCVAGILLIFFSTRLGVSSPSWNDAPRDHGKASAGHHQLPAKVIPVSDWDKETLSETQITHYLRFLNTLHGGLKPGPVPEEKKRELEDLIKSGHGLEPYVTEREEAAWIENGIVYRPWRKPDPSPLELKYPSPYTTEYESYIPFNEVQFFEGRKPDLRYRTQRKIMLWHTRPRYIEPQEHLQPLQVCPDFPCYITTNRNYSENSSAMIFAAQILDSAPPKRRPDQIFILHNHEPPYVNKFFERNWREGFKQPTWKQVFNWTMTYRMDSDLIAPYGIIRRRPTPLMDKDYRSIMGNKTKAVAWMVSNCNPQSQRSKYVMEMKKYIDIDIFGRCSKLKCPRNDEKKCVQMINKNYKFFLGFESALCPDYITEKMFHYLTIDTITVVRGIDQYFEHVPRELLINTADFPSPKALAERLHYLDKHDDAYIQILKKKADYMVYTEGYLIRNPDGFVNFLTHRVDSPAICLACQRLWNLEKYAKSEKDIHKWFDEKLCKNATDLNF